MKEGAVESGQLRVDQGREGSVNDGRTTAEVGSLCLSIHAPNESEAFICIPALSDPNSSAFTSQQDYHYTENYRIVLKTGYDLEMLKGLP